MSFGNIIAVALATASVGVIVASLFLERRIERQTWNAGEYALIERHFSKRSFIV